MTYQRRQQYGANQTLPGARYDDIERYIAKGRALHAETVAALLTLGVSKAAQLLRSVFTGGFRFSRRLISAIAREHQRRATVRALTTLDDHLLKDIGLSRSQIHGMVNGVFGSPEAAASRYRPAAVKLATARPANSDEKVKQAA